jgi:hypothetical protein
MSVSAVLMRHHIGIIVINIIANIVIIIPINVSLLPFTLSYFNLCDFIIFLMTKLFNA